MQRALVRQDAPVGRIIGKTRAEAQDIEFAAVLVHKVSDLRAAPRQEIDLGVAIFQRAEDAVVFTHGETDIDLAAHIARFIGREVGAHGVGVAIKQIKTLADAVNGKIGIQIADGVVRVDPAVVEIERDTLAAAQKIILHDAGVKDDALPRRETQAAAQPPAGRLFNRVIDIDLVRRAGHGHGLDIDLLEIAGALQPFPAALDLGGREPAPFLLAHFPPEHFILGLDIAREVDTAGIDALAGVDKEGQGHGPGGLVNIGDGIDVAE